MKKLYHILLLIYLVFFYLVPGTNAKYSNELPPPLWIDFYDPMMYWCWYKNAACNTNSGYIHPCVGGGTPPYTYLWSTGATTLDIDNIPPGTYTLTVYDAVGDSAVASQVITGGPVVFTFVAPMGLPCYNQCNGTVVYNPYIGSQPGIYFTGTPPFTFTTNHGTILNDWDAYTNSYSPGVTTITNICGGINVTVTATDANGCTGQETFNLPPPPFQNPSFSITPSCNSLPNGSVTVGNLSSSCCGMALEVITDTSTWYPYSCCNFTIPWTQNNLLPGNYYLAISHTPTNLNWPTQLGCPQFVPFTIPNLGITCNTIEGNVFIDLNYNCIQDSGEVGIPNTILQFTPGPYYSMTNSSGFFTTNLPVGSYTVTQLLPPGIIQTCTSAPDTFTISGGTPYYVINFADSSNIPLDVEASLGSGIARPGFNFNYGLNIKNHSYYPSGLLTLTFDYDTLLNFVSASPPPLSSTPGQITWQLNSLQNFQTAFASVTFNVPANPLLIGDTLTASINVVAANPESDLTNNSKIYKHIIMGSYDPNEKHVFPQGSMLPAVNEWLEYTILFQNTGNDTAFNVVIIDTLDANLNVSTFVADAASHPYETELSGQGIIKFIFNNILLPDSIADEPNSHGFISFKIKPKQNLSHNTIISNLSHIIFDFNPPITTNTVENVVDLTLGINTTETTICEGESVTLTMIPELQNANTTWRWRSGSCTGNLLGYGNSITISPAVTTTYFARDSLNTMPVNSCYRKTITVTPNASLSQNIFLCNGESISVGTNTYSASGTYIDSLQNVNGCDSVITTNLTVNSPVDVSVTVTANVITANASGVSYQWIDCDNNFALFPGETGQSFTASATGNYAVIVTENSCADTSACQFILVTGIISSQSDSGIEIYPNPTSGKIIIESKLKEKSEIEVTDVFGNIISKITVKENRSEIDISDHSKGIYFVKIIRGEKVEVVKIIYL